MNNYIIYQILNIMIKDKITSKLKERLKDAIKKTIDTGKEQGFYICKDKNKQLKLSKGKLFADKGCEGRQCDIAIGRPQDACLGEINQGDFHTHPYTSLGPFERMTLIKTYGYDRVKEDLKNVIKEEFKYLHEKEGLKDMSINTPSYIDTLKALGFKCNGLTQGTTCIDTDIEKDKVECWTVRKTDKNTMRKNCNKMEEEWKYAVRRREGIPIKKWIVSVFDKEIIDLK
jgi:hypothetical protein